MTLHERLVAKWTACEFGVKQRVFNDDMPQTSVQYILANPKYGDSEKMKWLIEAIDRHAKQFESEVLEMSNKVQSI